MRTAKSEFHRRLAAVATLLTGFAVAACERLPLLSPGAVAVGAIDGVYTGEAIRGSGTESRCDRRYLVRATVRRGEFALELLDAENAARTLDRTQGFVEPDGRVFATLRVQGLVYPLEGRFDARNFRGSMEASTCRLSLSARRGDGA